MDPLFNLTIALGLAALFAATGVKTLFAWSEWPGVLRNYRLLPEVLIGVAAVIFPVLHLLTAAALLWPAGRPYGGMLAAGLLLLYAAALAVNLHRGRTRIDCGCFGSRLGQGIARWMVVRNLALAVTSSSLLLPLSTRTLSTVDVLAALVCAASAVLLYPVIAVVLRPPPATFEENHSAAAAAANAIAAAGRAQAAG